MNLAVIIENGFLNFRLNIMDSENGTMSKNTVYEINK